MWLYHRVKSPKDVDGMANHVDPDANSADRDPTAPESNSVDLDQSAQSVKMSDLHLHCLLRLSCPNKLVFKISPMSIFSIDAMLICQSIVVYYQTK